MLYGPVLTFSNSLGHVIPWLPFVMAFHHHFSSLQTYYSEPESPALILSILYFKKIGTFCTSTLPEMRGKRFRKHRKWCHMYTNYDVIRTPPMTSHRFRKHFLPNSGLRWSAVLSTGLFKEFVSLWYRCISTNLQTLWIFHIFGRNKVL